MGNPNHNCRHFSDLDRFLAEELLKLEGEKRLLTADLWEFDDYFCELKLAICTTTSAVAGFGQCSIFGMSRADFDPAQSAANVSVPTQKSAIALRFFLYVRDTVN